MNLRGSRVTSIHRGSVLLFKQDGNERQTVNLVPARITRRAGAPSSKDEIFEISTENWIFQKKT